MAQAALGRHSMRLSESSDEVENFGQVDDWGGGHEDDVEEVEEVAVTISDGVMHSLCAELPNVPIVESELPRMSPRPDSGGDAGRSKERSSSAFHSLSPDRPAHPQSKGSPSSKSKSRSPSPSQPGSRSRSGSSSSKQPHRSVSRSSSSSRSRSSSSGSSSSSSSDDSRLQSSASEGSAR